MRPDGLNEIRFKLLRDRIQWPLAGRKKCFFGVCYGACPARLHFFPSGEHRTDGYRAQRSPPGMAKKGGYLSIREAKAIVKSNAKAKFRL